MAYISPYTLDEATELLTAYKDAEKCLVNGQAQSYRVGTREFTALDLEIIQRRIRELSKTIAALTGSARTQRAVMVIPRDL